MKNGNILIVGCGEIGMRTASKLVEAGYSVAGMRRNTAALPATVEPITADICDPDSLKQLAGRSFPLVLVSVAAAEFSEQAYRDAYVDGVANVLRALPAAPLQRVIMVSSTSVYHQNDASWVDEDSATLPKHFSGQVMLEAEALLASSSPVATVVRFGGIYGPGRTRLLRRVRQGITVAQDSPHYSNRIHSEDCAGVLAFLLKAAHAGESLLPCYLAVDNAPTPLREICDWLARAEGLDPADMEEQASPLRGGNRRCSNRRLLDAGYRFAYPDYRAGFGALLAAEPEC